MVGAGHETALHPSRSPAPSPQIGGASRYASLQGQHGMHPCRGSTGDSSLCLATQKTVPGCCSVSSGACCGGDDTSSAPANAGAPSPQGEGFGAPASRWGARGGIRGYLPTDVVSGHFCFGFTPPTGRDGHLIRLASRGGSRQATFSSRRRHEALRIAAECARRHPGMPPRSLFPCDGRRSDLGIAPYGWMRVGALRPMSRRWSLSGAQGERHLIRPSVRTGAPSPQGEGFGGAMS